MLPAPRKIMLTIRGFKPKVELKVEHLEQAQQGNTVARQLALPVQGGEGGGTPLSHQKELKKLEKDREKAARTQAKQQEKVQDLILFLAQ